jgi:hypothetical protein
VHMLEEIIGKIEAEGTTIRQPRLVLHLGITSQTAKRWREAKRLPEPLILGPRMIFYDTRAVVAALREHFAAQPAEVGA